MKQLIDSLIEQYGENASIHFDSGYNSISEEIKISRLESDKEFETRKNKEISKLENKAKRLKKELNQITEKIKKT